MVEHAKILPTLARMALNVLPCQASVTCKLPATYCCTRLGFELFEKLQIMKHVWHPDVVNYDRVNSEEVYEVQGSLQEYEALLAEETELEGWENKGGCGNLGNFLDII